MNILEINTQFMSLHRRIITTVLFAVLTEFAIAQGAVSLTNAVERQFNKIESDIISAAQAMPEAKYYFTPDTLHIAGSNFKGVRTFAGQIMHLATDNILIWSAITRDQVRPD